MILLSPLHYYISTFFFTCIVCHCLLFLSCVFSRVLFVIVSYFCSVFFFTCIVYHCLLFFLCVFFMCIDGRCLLFLLCGYTDRRSIFRSLLIVLLYFWKITCPDICNMVKLDTCQITSWIIYTVC